MVIIMGSVTFPKIGEKHRLNPLFSPDHILKEQTQGVPKRAVFVYGKHVEEAMDRELELYNDRKLARHIVNSDRMNRSRQVRDLLVVKLAIGAPLTATVAEELFAIGVKEIVIMGIAGALDKRLNFGDIVVCSKAVRDEGTSHHYLKNSMYVYPSAKLMGRLESITKRLGIAYSKGATWTIDAPYAETVQEVIHYRKKGILTVEMEAAALFAVAEKRRKAAGAIFTISDILDPEGWSGFDEHGKRIRKREAYPKMARIAKEFGKGR